jgi:hypothetical protein
MHDNRTRLVLFAPTVVALWFINSYAAPYLTVERERFGIYWARHDWLYVHIIAGMVALLLGPLQLWLGLNRKARVLHRVLGVGYVLGVAVSGTAAFYLARHTDFGWIFRMGMTAMALAWVVSTAMALVAIGCRMVEQHREWMVRSYVVTFGFVTFRVFLQVIQVAGVGTTLEQMTAASWFSWTIPLLVTEWIMQARKIVALRRELLITTKTQRQEEAERHEEAEVTDLQPLLFPVSAGNSEE